MARGAELVVRILTDASKAADGIDKASSDFGKFESSMQSMAIPAAAVAGGVALIGTAAVNAASETQQSMGAIDAVFGDSAGQIKKWAAQASESVGLSTAEYGQFASVVGAQLKNLGVPFDQVAGGTDDLIKLGADLAATYGGTTQQAVEALSSALRGEADPAERYGLALNQTAVNAELAAQGLTGLEGEALTAAKAQAIMAMATEQAGGAVGQFGREADTVAGQQQRANASWQDAAAALGEQLLPVVTKVTQMFAEFAKWVQQNAGWIMPLIAAIGALAAVILVINGALIAYNAVQSAMKVATAISTAAQWAWNAAMTANPIGILIVAIAALIAGFIYLWNTNEDFRNFFINTWNSIADFFTALWKGLLDVVKRVVDWFKSAWDAVAKFFKSVWDIAVQLVMGYFNFWFNTVRAIVEGVRAVVNSVVNFFVNAWQGAVNTVSAIIRTLQSVFTSVINAIMVPINWLVDAFNNVVGAIKNVINWLGKIKIPDVFGAIGDFIGGRGVAAAPAGVSTFAGPSVQALGAGRAAAAGSTTIYVQGGLDSGDTIARRIEQVLAARERRTTGVTLRRRTA